MVQDFQSHVYNMPYARAAPYFVGAFCALLLLQVEEAKKVRYLQYSGRKFLLSWKNNPCKGNIHGKISMKIDFTDQ